MPLATDDEVATHILKRGSIRLACLGGCFRDDHDGIWVLPSDWTDIEEVQSLQDSLSVYDDDDDDPAPPGYSVMDWETHAGLCPDCQVVPLIVGSAS